MASLLDSPGGFEFFQALRLLENGAVAGVRGRAVGMDHPPQEEVVRLRGSPSLGFPVNIIESVVARRGSVPGQSRSAELSVTGLGMLGAVGPLPHHYSEHVFERTTQRDRSLRDFVDALQHRSLAFFYRAWRKYRLPFAYEAAGREGKVDDITSMLLGLVGLGSGGLGERLAEGAHRWLYFAGLFANPQRTAVGLESMLAEVTGSVVNVQEFVGRWQTLLPEERSRLGGRGDDEYRNCLGSSLILGERSWDVLSGVRIRIGPVPAGQLADYSSRTGRYHWVADLVKSYLGPDRDFEMVCMVDPATVRAVRLGSSSSAGLGGSAWLAAREQSSYSIEVPLCPSR